MFRQAINIISNMVICVYLNGMLSLPVELPASEIPLRNPIKKLKRNPCGWTDRNSEKQESAWHFSRGVHSKYFHFFIARNDAVTLLFTYTVICLFIFEARLTSFGRRQVWLSSLISSSFYLNVELKSWLCIFLWDRRPNTFASLWILWWKIFHDRNFFLDNTPKFLDLQSKQLANILYARFLF